MYVFSAAERGFLPGACFVDDHLPRAKFITRPLRSANSSGQTERYSYTQSFITRQASGGGAIAG